MTLPNLTEEQEMRVILNMSINDFFTVFDEKQKPWKQLINLIGSGVNEDKKPLFKNVRELALKTESELRKIRGLGWKKFIAIRCTLERAGLSLGMDQLPEN